jgi:mannosyl-3-phosphoglycerate phosphatase
VKTPFMVIFSDLDNCLLERDSYDFSEASGALDEIRRRNIPLVLVSSKTRAEIELHRSSLAITAPFVAESGGALYLPNGSGTGDKNGAKDGGGFDKFEWGFPYETIRAALVEARQRFAVRGFGDMDVQEIMAHTGLTRHNAQLAAAREYSEPFLLEHPEQLLPLITWAAEKELQILLGGRFYHLVAAGQDKGRAVRFLIEHYRRHHDGPVLSMALGDSPNDLPMLAAVDMPVLLPNHDGGFADLHLPQAIRATAPSSRGWNHQVLAFIRLVGSSPEKETAKEAISLHTHDNPEEIP